MRVSIIVLLGFCVGLVSSNAVSEVNKNLSDGLSRCLSVSIDQKRLNCFDDLAISNQTSREKLNSVITDNDFTASSEQEKSEIKQKIDDFAKEDLVKTVEEQGLESITSTITKIKKLLRGRLIIDLDNGQQWEQKDSTQINLKEGNIITLKKGALGAVFLSKENSNRSIRVKRLK